MPVIYFLRRKADFLPLYGLRDWISHQRTFIVRRPSQLIPGMLFLVEPALR